MDFKNIEPTELTINPFSAIGNDWMLITAGNEQKHNTMTASWGGLGVLWGKKTAFCFIRPQRYTLEFVDNNDLFTLSIFDHKLYKDALDICGKYSGRDIDKDEKAGITPLYTDGTVAYNEAKLIFVVKKLYRQDIDPKYFLDPSIDKNYAQKDYHKMFVGEIVKVYEKK